MIRRLAIPVLVLVAGGILVINAATAPDAVLLWPYSGADWIIRPQPVYLTSQKPGKLISTFRTQVEIVSVPSHAVLRVCAVGSPSIWLDGRLLRKPNASATENRTCFGIDIRPFLTPGLHELRFQVERTRGYPLLWAYCEPLNLKTNNTWEVSSDEKNWISTSAASSSPSANISLRFERADRALISLWWIFLPVFLAVFLGTIALSQQDRANWLSRHRPTASQIRWFVILLWVILGLNNIWKIPIQVGMDAWAHYDYIFFVADKARIPVATEGWQMFQPPLFYMICAAVFAAYKHLIGGEYAAMMLREVTLLCGLIQVELCYRAVRIVQPHREDLQSIGTILGGLLPMNIYMSQVVGNEPLAAVFSGIAVVIGLQIFSKPAVPSKRSCAFLGGAIGLAVLTKPTAFLLIIPILICLSRSVFSEHKLTLKSAGILAQLTAVFLGVAALISAWYYLRNYFLMGHFFLGGWDQPATRDWWQYPSYRTLHDLTAFGECLFYPVYSAVHGIWDALYSTFWADGFLSGLSRYEGRPPWNYNFMLSTVWLSLVPSAGMILGILVVITRPRESMKTGSLFPVLCVFVYFLAIFHLYLVLPIYSTAKASYTLGLIPCYAVLASAGLGVLIRGPVSKALVLALMACWAIAAYGAFFVV